jgi:hypothetical protein
MKKIMTTIVTVTSIFVLSCIPEITAPHSNPLDPDYMLDETPPSAVDLATLNEYYRLFRGIA